MPPPEKRGLALIDPSYETLENPPGRLADPVLRAALEAARQRSVPVVVDPKFRHFFEYRGATVFKPNAFGYGQIKTSVLFRHE